MTASLHPQPFNLGVRMREHQEPAGLFCTQHGVTRRQVGPPGVSQFQTQPFVCSFLFLFLRGVMDSRIKNKNFQTKLLEAACPLPRPEISSYPLDFPRMHRGFLQCSPFSPVCFCGIKGPAFSLHKDPHFFIHHVMRFFQSRGLQSRAL